MRTAPLSVCPIGHCDQGVASAQLEEGSARARRVLSARNQWQLQFVTHCMFDPQVDVLSMSRGRRGYFCVIEFSHVAILRVRD